LVCFQKNSEKYATKQYLSEQPDAEFFEIYWVLILKKSGPGQLI